MKFLHWSGPDPAISRSFGSICTIRSGSPIFHLLSSNTSGGGVSAGFPRGAPESTHFTIVAISSSEIPLSFLNFRMHTLGLTYHDGLIRNNTFYLIEF